MAQQREIRGNSHRNLPELNAWTRQRREAALEPDLPIVDPRAGLVHILASLPRASRRSEDLLRVKS